MKARYQKTFEYGRSLAKTSLICAIGSCLVSLMFMESGTLAQLLTMLLTVVLMVTTIVIMYKYCRCPYCGKRIVMGVLSARSCPSCRRNLETGKKTKR